MSKYPISEEERARRSAARYIDDVWRHQAAKERHERRLREDPEYAERCARNVQALQRLTRALEAGGYAPAPLAGQSLVVEPLEATMQMVTFDDRHIKIARPIMEGSIFRGWHTDENGRDRWRDPRAPALIGMTRKSGAPRAAAGFCGYCGANLHMCRCLDGLEETPVVSSAPAPTPKNQGPEAVQPPTRTELAAKRTTGAIVRQGSIDPRNLVNVCYFCGPTNRPITQVRSTDALICGECALIHLGE